MSLGQAQSSKFHIGNAEIRIGTLQQAMQLRSQHSLGLLQTATVNFQQDSVDLEGGLPKQLIDTAITKTNVTISAQAYEYTRRNIRVMLNEGAEDIGTVNEYEGTLTTPTQAQITAAVTAVTDPGFGGYTLAQGVGFAGVSMTDYFTVDQSTAANNQKRIDATWPHLPGPVNGVTQTLASYTSALTSKYGFLALPVAGLAVEVKDLLVLYNENQPESVSTVRVIGKYNCPAIGDSVPTCTIVTIDLSETPVTFDVYAGCKFYKANQVGLGTQSKSNYFAASVIGMEHSTGKPIGFNFWKVAVGGGLEYGFSNDNFAVTPITFKILAPSASDYAQGGALYHLRNIIPTNPYGMYFAG